MLKIENFAKNTFSKCFIKTHNTLKKILKTKIYLILINTYFEYHELNSKGTAVLVDNKYSVLFITLIEEKSFLSYN